MPSARAGVANAPTARYGTGLTPRIPSVASPPATARAFAGSPLAVARTITTAASAHVTTQAIPAYGRG